MRFFLYNQKLIYTRSKSYYAPSWDLGNYVFPILLQELGLPSLQP